MKNWKVLLFAAAMAALFFGAYAMIIGEFPPPRASNPPITTTQGAAQHPNYNHPDDTETRP